MAIHIRRREFIVTLLSGAAAGSAVCCERAAGSKRWIGEVTDVATDALAV
jgi:hypothetical protein